LEKIVGAGWAEKPSNAPSNKQVKGTVEMKKSQLMVAVTAAVFSNVSWGTEEQSQEAKIDSLRRSVRLYSETRHPSLERPAQMKQYAQDNGIPSETLYEMVYEIVEEARASLESDPPVNEAIKCARMLGFLGGTKDPRVLPFLLKCQESSHKWVRRSAFLSYINVTGVDALPVLKKAVADEEIQSFWITFYEQFIDALQKGMSEKKSQPKVNEGFRFLLDQIQNEQNISSVYTLDKLLCDILPEYRTSQQREVLAQRFVNSTHERTRSEFTRIQKEVEQTPKEKRADMRQRFTPLPEPEEETPK
jgi:hypothetical protein